MSRWAMTLGKLRFARAILRLQVERGRTGAPKAGIATLRRWFWLHRPGFALAGAGLVFAIPLGLGLLSVEAGGRGSAPGKFDLTINLGEHLLAAIVIGGIGYWWVYGFTRQRALRGYRQRLRESDGKFVDWYAGETTTLNGRAQSEPESGAEADETRVEQTAHDAARVRELPCTGPLRRLRNPSTPRRLRGALSGIAGAEQDTTPWYVKLRAGRQRPPRPRRRACERLGDEIIGSRSPSVAIVKGRAGTGRTAFVVELVDYLAGKGLVPIPLLAAHGRPRTRAEGPELDLERQAKEKFYERIDAQTRSSEQIEKIWKFACQTRRVVVVLDGLDKELFENLEANDDTSAARKTISDLQRSQIHLVLATTLDLDLELNIEKQLGLESIASLLREDLDRFTYPEACEYLKLALPPSLATRAESTLEASSDTDESRVDPFFLDLLVRLTKEGRINGLDRPMHVDEWRRSVLERYLEEVCSDTFLPVLDARASLLDQSLQDSRGHQAFLAARAVAVLLRPDVDLTVERKQLEDFDPGPLRDAQKLNLLRLGQRRLSFTSDELGAYMFALTRGGQASITALVRKVASGEIRSLRHQRFVLIAFTFWLLEHEQQRDAGLEEFLTILETHKPARPRLAAAALRILAACPDLLSAQRSPRLRPASERVEAVVRASAGALAEKPEPAAWQPDPQGPVRFVRALSASREMPAEELLWSLATTRKLDVAWPAINVLADVASVRKMKSRVLGIVEDVTRAKETPTSLSELNEEDSKLGNELASIAWLLPAILAADEEKPVADELWRKVKDVCLDGDVTVLRGEMALAQGLKLAALMQRDIPSEGLEELLHRPLSFWHARIVAVQALVAYAWNARARAPHEPRVWMGEIRRCFQLLEQLRDTEEHDLTKRAIELGLEALATARLAAVADPARLHEYVWTHEHEAVTWVEQRKWRLSQLAADTVLLSNMICERWKAGELEAATSWATTSRLPGCIADSSKRMSMISPALAGQRDKTCDCPLCGAGRRGSAHWVNRAPVVGTWARFTEAFCRQQARLVTLHGLPSWIGGEGIGSQERAERVKLFWGYEAQLLAELQLDRDGGISTKPDTHMSNQSSVGRVAFNRPASQSGRPEREPVFRLRAIR